MQTKCSWISLPHMKGWAGVDWKAQAIPHRSPVRPGADKMGDL